MTISHFAKVATAGWADRIAHSLIGWIAGGRSVVMNVRILPTDDDVKLAVGKGMFLVKNMELHCKVRLEKVEKEKTE